MPAKSVAQENLMNLALRDPKKVRPENKGVLDMAKGSLEDFASTPRKGLPKHAPKKSGLAKMADRDKDGM